METTKILIATLLFSTAAHAQTPEKSWLDRPLANWNSPGRVLPRPPALALQDETMPSVAKRCTLPLLRNTSGEKALANAGWLPFHLFDRQIVQRDVEIVGGLAGADGMCRPMDFNVFVFVGGKPAGTLSPSQMDSRIDASVGVIRLAEDGTISADFARYAETDPLCCPSGRVNVRYRIDRKATPPVVVPVSVRATRQ